ncbi:MAG TPA: trehalase-like domain-containing protein [Acidimicrobiales bacterium]|nr:trehalase-like domain-containing protein [Acidimicrobiales bacterium]
MITDAGRVPIGRRAWIGNGRHGASLAPDGTIDWYAAGGLSARPDLWRLLDPGGPAVRVGPVRDGSGARRHLPASQALYRPGTNIVDTVAEAAGGRRLMVTDFVPHDEEGGICRLIRALSGPVDIEVEVLAGPDRRPGGIRRVVAPVEAGLTLDGLTVSAPARFEPAPLDRDTPRWRAVFSLDTGEEAAVTIGFDRPLSVGAVRLLLDDTTTAEHSWLAPIAYTGPFRASVERSLLAIRSLTGPSGAPAAAGTTSLPRRIGSERSADDRWVRLRDVARAVPVLAGIGRPEDAENAETWLRNTVSTAHLPWPAWLDADGQPVPDAEEVPFEGWRRNQPVRLGRLSGPPDVGLVGPVTAATGASMSGPYPRPDDPGPLSAAFDALAEATDWACDHWREPDEGPWEVARPLRRYTAGRLGAWNACRRMAQMARAANPLDLRAVTWQQEGADLLHWMESSAVAADGGLRMDGRPDAPDESDAALLAVAWSGPWPMNHPIVAATVGRVIERLSSGPLLYRYSDRVADERAGPDLPDLEVSLLGVKALAHLEDWDRAHDRMEGIVRLIDAAGPGLPAETADPISGELFGNFPSTAVALMLIEAASALTAGPR